MKSVTSLLLTLTSLSVFAIECDSRSIIMNQTHKAMNEFSQIPNFKTAKSIKNYKLAKIHNGSINVESFSIAALNKDEKIVALGYSSVDITKCELMVNEDGSISNSFSFSIIKN